jgi:hypothetical protein
MTGPTRVWPLAGALLLAWSGSAAAQTLPQPPDPDETARVRVGPFAIRPSLILRDVGIDSNVFNEAQQPHEDFTATMGARVDVGFRMPKLQATYASTFEYLYFTEFASERGLNRGSEGRVDVLLGRLRPHVTGSILDSHDRPNAEIDARAHRQQYSYGGGVAFLLLSRTALSASYRRSSTSYDGDEFFAGVSLADALNVDSEATSASLDLELTPLTTMSVGAEWGDDRFELSPERNARMQRYGVTFTFQPSALVSGRAQVGYRSFQPESAALPEFNGLAAAVSLAYSFREETRVAVVFDRDVRYSYTDTTPYYVSTATRVTLTQRLFGPVDAQGVAGRERLEYEARLDAPEAARADRLTTIGGGLGYRLGNTARIGVNLERTERSSPVEDRRFTRRRIVASISYGF